MNKVINLTQYERYIDQVMIDFDGVKGRLNMLSPLYWIVTRGSRLVPLHNRKELCGIDYQAAFELILGAKEVFDDLHFEHRHYELPVASKSRDQRDSTRKDEVFIELIQQLNGHLHGSDKVTARSNKTARRKYSSESSDQETPKAVISETSNKLVHREAIVEEDKIKESDRFVTTRRKKDITEEEDKLEVNQVDIKVKSPICEEMGDDEVPNRIRKYSPPKKLDLRLKAVNLSFSTIKAGRAKRKKVATRHHHRLIAFGEQRIRELHKKPKQSSQKKIGDAAFYSSCIGSLFLAMKKKKNWLEESFDGDLAHEEDHLPQYRLDFNKTIINRIKVNAKIYKMKNEESTLKNALRNRAPIKNVLPLFFKERVLSEFMDNTEIQVEYPLAKYIRLTFCNNLTKFQEKAFVNYFGEKIALLFAFNNFFRDRLVFIAIVGLLYVAYDIYNRIKNLLDGKTKISADGYYQLLSILFACILTHSKSRFMVAWSTYERNFSERYGQSSIEQTDAPRSQFKGSYIRSVVSDRMNNKMDIRWTRVVKHIVANFLMLVWGAIVGVTCYYLLMTKRFIDSQQYSWDRNIIFGSSGEILTDFIEFIRIKLFDLVFFSIAKRMSTWLNFKFEAEYELDLSLRLSISQFFNNSMIIWLIFYDHLSSTHYKPVSLENGATVYYHWSDVCFGNDCEQELTTYFLVYSLFQLLWAVVFNLAIKTSWSTFIYKFKLLKYFQHLATRADWSLYKFTFGNNKKKANNFNKKTSSIEFSKQLKKGLGANKDADEAAIKKVYQEQAAMYRKPNMEIEKQLFLLEDYTDKDDFDCSSFDYLYMVNSFSYIILYGCIFSHCFATVWLLLASEYSVMRHRLLFVCKRPTPKAASSIGLWFTMMQVVSKMSVFTNALYIAFMVFQVETLAFKLVSLLVSVLVLALIDWVNYLPMFTDKHWTLDLTEKRNAFISNLIDNCGPAIHSKKIIDAAEAINKEIAVKKIEQENEANPKKTKNRSAKRNEELKASKPETKPKDATKSTGNKAEIVIAPNYHRIFEATMTSEQDDILRKQLEEQEEIGYGLLLNLSDFQPDFAPK